MKGLEDSTNLILYIISNAVAILMLWTAWKNIRLARLLFFLIFAWASWTNWKTALYTPETYLGEADLTFFGFYREFILGWFSEHIYIAVGFVATCQALIAFSMLLKGWWLKTGALGAVIFLLGIAPFGVGSAFPCTVLLAIAMFRIYSAGHPDYLWIGAKNKPVWH